MNNDLYEWLEMYVLLCNDIDALELDLKYKWIERKRWANNVDGSQGDLAKQQTYLTSIERLNKCDEVIEQLSNRLEEKEKQRQEIIGMVNKFKGIENKILKLKYIEGMTLERVAEESGYSYQYIKSKHAEIMRRITFNRNV